LGFFEPNVTLEHLGLIGERKYLGMEHMDVHMATWEWRGFSMEGVS